MSFLSARLASGLSQAAAAKELGVTDAAVCMWENGKHLPRAALLPKVAALYGCSIDCLLSEDPNSTAPETPSDKPDN